MERDGLVHVAGDRHLTLSDHGRTLATRVMRKHRLAECLLVGIIKLPWEEVHIEACRWEHVISRAWSAACSNCSATRFAARTAISFPACPNSGCPRRRSTG
jgi:Mn-dependent transcriptional regulator